jgi:hypothetical protein
LNNLAGTSGALMKAIQCATVSREIGNRPSMRGESGFWLRNGNLMDAPETKMKFQQVILRVAVAILTAMAGVSPVPAATFTWNGDGADANWKPAANWAVRPTASTVAMPKTS